MYLLQLLVIARSRRNSVNVTKVENRTDCLQLVTVRQGCACDWRWFCVDSILADASP